MALYSSARKAESDRYLPAQREIISQLFNFPTSKIETAPIDLDMTEGVDLVLPDTTRIAVRTRYKWYGDFAFRHSRDGIRDTEWEKLCRGQTPRFYLYTIGRPDASLASWWLLDVTVIHDAILRGWTRCTPYREEPNYGDGVVLVGLSDYPTKYGNRPFVLASSEQVAQAA